MSAAAGAGRTRPAATGARTGAPGSALLAATDPVRLRHQQARAFPPPAGGARGWRDRALPMRWPAARYRYRCRCRCRGAVPIPFVRDAGGAVPPSLPIKLVFLSPPALPALRTGGAAAAARTMGPRLPAAGTGPGTAVGTPAAGTSASSVRSRTGAGGRARGPCRGRVPSEHHQRSHRYRRSRGLASRRDGAPGGGWFTPRSLARAGGEAGFSGHSPAAPGAARACSPSQGSGLTGLLCPPACFTCKLLPGDWLAGQRRGIAPPAAPARAGRACGWRWVQGRGAYWDSGGPEHTKDPQGGRRCSRCPGL